MELLIVNERQSQSPLVKRISIPLRFEKIRPDFQCDRAMMLLLTMRFHLQHPMYIQTRMRECAREDFHSRVLLLLIDCAPPSYDEMLLALSALADAHGYLLVLEWSAAEAAVAIMALASMRQAGDHALKGAQRLKENGRVRFLAALPGVSDRDAEVLLEHFGSLRAVVSASRKDLEAVPRLTARKVDVLLTAFGGRLARTPRRRVDPEVIDIE